MNTCEGEHDASCARCTLINLMSTWGIKAANVAIDAYTQELADKLMDFAAYGHPAARVAREDAARFISPKKQKCPYTFAHTRHWCGYDTCRDS